MEHVAALADNTLDLFLEAAPWLLFGLAVAGLIKAWLPEEVLRRLVGGRGVGPVVKAALIGAPLPLCSCGVLPAAVGLRRAGASRSATVSFMISTPETGVDSVSVSYAMLGPFMAVVRPIAAVASAVFTGLLVGLLPEEDRDRPAAANAGAAGCGSGCGSECGGGEPPVRAGLAARTVDGVRYALTDVLDDIAGWMVVGLVLAGAVATFVPPQALAEWGSGPAAMAVMLVVGIPMYICATASTPVAASLLIAGVSPGAVMVFLLAGPATNVATLAVARREMGMRTMVLYLFGICASAVIAGLLVEAAAGWLTVDVAAEMATVTEVVPLWLAAGSALILVLLAVRRFVPQSLRRAAARAG